MIVFLICLSGELKAAIWCVQSLSVEFLTILIKFKNISRHFEKQFCHLLKIIRQKDDFDRRLERITYYKIFPDPSETF